MLGWFRPKVAMTKPVDPRQWAEAFKQKATSGSEDVTSAPELVQQKPKSRDPFSFGS